MSAQLIEMLIFAGIALVLINKLISLLGTTDEDDPTKQNSFFGEPSVMKDVTDTSYTVSKKVISKELLDIIDIQNKDKTIKELEKLKGMLSGFDITKFIKSAKVVFQMIIKALNDEDTKTLHSLIDKRYIEKFINEKSQEYKKIKISSPEDLNTKISDICIFGNNVTITVIFTKKNAKLHEEWTFLKNVLEPSPDWYLSNIYEQSQ